MPLPKLETRGGNPLPFSHAADFAHPFGAIEVGEHQDEEQFGAGSGAESVEAFSESALHLRQRRHGPKVWG